MIIEEEKHVRYDGHFLSQQAGYFGVAQTRRRAILMAAAPGEVLPAYPEPSHCFASTSLNAQIGDKMCEHPAQWIDAAPYRTVTCKDVFSDLPKLDGKLAVRENYLSLFPIAHINCFSPFLQHLEPEDDLPYGTDPITAFQRQMRRNSPSLLDHYTKEMSELVKIRMELIPTEPGSDWRDLPNIVMRLEDGNYTEKLVYK